MKAIQVGRRLLRPSSSSSSISISSRSLSTAKTNEWFVFPREAEGNQYSVNWSLVADGISPSMSAYRNARPSLLSSRLPSKVNNGKVEVSGLKFTGSFSLLEAGDSISHDKFAESLKSTAQRLSAVDIYVEDHGVVAHAGSRVGVRVVTDSPAVALIARSLSIPVPNREVNPRARFNGWRLDQNLGEQDVAWNGKTYDFSEKAIEPGVGQRPVVVLVGGAGGDVAVQFVESNKVITGANVLVGQDAPIRAIVEGISHAATVVLNEQNSNLLALPSVALAKGKETVLVVGGSDDLAAAAAAKGVLYGAYSNVLSAQGLSALFNGVIDSAAAATASERDGPAVVSEGKGVRAIVPNNMAFPPSHIVFMEKGASKGSISEENAVVKLTGVTDEKKKEIAAALVSGVKLSVAGSVEDVLALI